MSEAIIETPEMQKRFYEEYTVPMIRKGRLTTLIAGILTLLPPLYLWLGMGIKPEWDYILAGWGIIGSSYLLIYVFEPIGFYPEMGLSGIYIGYLAGNIPPVRLPAMLSARAATGCEAGTKRGELVGVIAIGMSVFVNLAFVTLAAIVGAAILEVLPKFVMDSFGFTLPAILGGVMAQYWKRSKVFTPLIFIICCIISKSPLPGIAKFPGAIVTAGVLGYIFYKMSKNK